MTIASASPRFCVREVPFSLSGSWLDLSCVIAEKTVVDDVHLISHQGGFHPVLRFVPTSRGARALVGVAATPASLTWSNDEGQIEAAWQSPDTVRVTGRGLDLAISAADPVLTPFSGSYFFRDPVCDAYVLTSYQTGRRYRVTLLAGGVCRSTGVESVGGADRGLVIGGDLWEVAIEEFDSARPEYHACSTFQEVVAASTAAFGAFLAEVAPWRDDSTPAAALAAYVLWSATVRPAGLLSRPTVLMSKHWMDKLWSWDHCFTALALAGVPALAWDQFLTPFDHQDGAGSLPDSVTHSEVLYNFVKPPVHGWALARLRQDAPHRDPETLRDVYRRLSAWTEFWLTSRRAPGRSLAHYQHGNDSGWDNASTFDRGRVVETADLAAFLVLQLRELAALAAELGLPDAVTRWGREADLMLAALLGELWRDGYFVTRGVLSDQTWTSHSLLDLMPIVLGELLPPAVSARLAERIAGHLTEHGLATEHPDSTQYRSDGYWRGPVWAPVTVLIEDGLRRAGHRQLADEISRRFRAMCERAGFAENFDAHTGAGQRDLAYTWTASAYLLLARAARAAASGCQVHGREAVVDLRT